MSPRRKSGLSKDDLEALEHLPAVIRALENLQEQHAKVRALMREPQLVGAPPIPPVGAAISAAHALQLLDAHRPRALSLTEMTYEQALEAARTGVVPVAPPTANIITDERREYEAAKKAGKEVPPDLANISEAQRERMAEQKALVQQMRRAKGLPVAGDVEPVTEDQVVRTEELPTSESGSVGGEEDPEVH